MIDGSTTRIAAFVARWQGIVGGAERANYTIFVRELCDALDLPPPGIAAGGSLGDYQYEGPVPGGSRGGGTGFIDVYHRGRFILEAKQSKLSAADQARPELFDAAPGAPATPSGAKYDQLMRDARRQAEHYAHNLPAAHAPVPFLIVCDVGRAFELYFDYAGNGRGYAFFPDKQRYRIALGDLTSDVALPGVDRTPADILRAIWRDPAAIDPRVRAADVTRDVARKLAQVSLHLEEQGQRELKRRTNAGPEDEAALIEGTALFLMRILFCMFAEDVELLPKDRFTEFLQSCVRPYDPANPGDLIDEPTLRNGLVSLWTAMDAPDPGARYAFALREQVRHFNGGLFGRRDFYPLARNDLDSLIDAAKHRWTNVEPAIFGTLLEQALSAQDRAKLGAHYTPRPYVERLVQATITDVLAPEWAAAQDAIAAAREAGDAPGALARATAFLTYLQAQRVLDPACGTGNFLYVAMETLLRLESDVIETIAALGGTARPTIGPHQFLGLELNPRAAVIAELVLWIGWLRWRTANDPAAVPDPVLRRTQAINFGSTHGYDAILARDDTGDIARPPRPAPWPEAEFIVGNPPFIGGKNLRERLGSDYAEAMWRANPRVSRSADLVMQWWDRAAAILTTPDAPLRRFGFVTTNSITQLFSRRVIEGWMAPSSPLLPGERQGVPAPSPLPQEEGKLHLTLAVADHPWTKGGKDAAAVRIAMTVAQAGSGAGRLVTITREAALDTDAPELETESRSGTINADLSVGTDVTRAVPLRANEGLCTPGVKLHGAGFIVTPAQAKALGLGTRPGLEAHIRDYRNGRDLLQRPRGAMVIDLFGLSEAEVMDRFPEVYQHVLTTVRVDRVAQVQKSPTADAKAYLATWWVFGKPRTALRPALAGLPRYITTVESAARRIFQFVEDTILPDNKIIVVASDDAFVFGVMNSMLHIEWWVATAGMLGSYDRPAVYVKSQSFDPFPFPDPSDADRTRIAAIAERLDATRRAALAEDPALTMTDLYNLVAEVRVGAALAPAREAAAVRARARIVAKLHDDLDAAVADAYGWGEDHRAGRLTPAAIVTRLVALNAARAAEEAAGHIRWLRPDYQRARFG